MASGSPRYVSYETYVGYHADALISHDNGEHMHPATRAFFEDVQKKTIVILPPDDEVKKRPLQTGEGLFG